MQLAASVAQFLSALLTFDRLQPATVRTYRSGLAGLVSRHGELEVALLERALVTTWLLEVNQGKAPDTVRLTLVAWERWQAWAVTAGHLPAPLLPKQRKPSGRQRTALPSKEQLRTLVAHAPADWLLLFRALRLTGARPGELCRATIADLTRDRGSIVLQEHKTARKTGQAREIALGHSALPDILATAIGERTEGPIFLRSGGSPWTPPAFCGVFRRLRKAAGLPDDLIPYLLRHEHGTEMYRKTRDILGTAKLMGHKKVTMTERYVRVDLGQLQRDQRLFDEGLEVPPPD